MELGRTNNAGSPPGLVRHGWLRINFWKGSFGPEGAAGQGSTVHQDSRGGQCGWRLDEGRSYKGRPGRWPKVQGGEDGRICFLKGFWQSL